MFRNTLTQTALTTPQANYHWKDRIDGLPYRNDTTFVATLRMLFDKQVPEGSRLIFDIREASSPMTAGIAGYIDTLFLSIYSNGKDIEEVTATALSDNPSFKRVQKVTDFYASVMKVSCIVNEETRVSVIYTAPLDMARYHYLQCSVPVCLPWLFDPKAGIAKESKELLMSLREDNSLKYESILREFASNFDFITAYRDKSLREFETTFFKERRDAMESEIADISSDIESYVKNISELVQRRSMKEAMLVGIRQKIAEGADSDELARYFASNKHLIFESCEGGDLRFKCKNTLMFWEEDVARDFIENDESWLYDNVPYDIREDIQSLLTAIFIDRKIKMNMCGAFHLMSGGTDYARREVSYNEPEFADCIPNPHIQRHRCISGYVPTIQGFLIEHRYIEAIEQCIASTGNLNFNDSTVMGEFMEWLCGDTTENMHGFVLPDGTVTDTDGAIAYLKGE